MREDLTKKVDVAIKRLQAFCPPEGYWVAFSGGKDSTVIKHLCDMAGVKYDAHYNVTSVDPPELVQFIRQSYPDVAFDIRKDKDGKPVTMWSLIAKSNVPPTRRYRYCCAELKEASGKERVTVTGVRWAESPRRKNLHGVVNFQAKPVGTRKIAEKIGADFRINKNGSVILNDDNDPERRMVEQCYRTRKTLVNPIIDWEDEDVWDFIHEYNLPYCALYGEGFKRLGCIGCPLANKKNMIRDFLRWPKYQELYIRAFQRMADNHPGKIKVLLPERREKYPLDEELVKTLESARGGVQAVEKLREQMAKESSLRGLCQVSGSDRWHPESESFMSIATNPAVSNEEYWGGKNTFSTTGYRSDFSNGEVELYNWIMFID